jgi:poly(ADP-ribose) glycohydrolase ARH3
MNAEMLRQKFLGSLVGTAIGDAVGAFSEGWYGTWPEEAREMADRQSRLVYTDDTAMMIGVAESLAEKRGIDAEHMADVFARNYYREPYRGYGPGPPRIFQLMMQGEAWDKAAEMIYPGGSFGNGSAMRIAPVGVLYHDSVDDLRMVAYESSRITHAHELGKEGAALQACAVALVTGLNPSAPFSGEDFVANLEGFVHHELYKHKIDEMRRLMGESDKSRVVSSLGNGIEAFNSVPAAIYSFLSHPGSFEESVLYAISLGGDTDTIGAMNGAIAGAYLGIDSIPERWREKLENREYIEDLARRLWLIADGDKP